MAKRTEDRTVLERNEMLNEAIRFAVEAHAGQLRKGSEMPYVVHAMEVLSILAAISDDIELLMAGVLHDCIEDGLLPDGKGGMRPVTREDIKERFGERTAELVAAHSEDKDSSWEERKTKALQELERVVKPGGKIIIPTYINMSRNTGTIAVKFISLLGADFKRQFDLDSYKKFFSDMGYSDVAYHVVDGRMPCAIAIITKRKNNNEVS